MRQFLCLLLFVGALGAADGAWAQVSSEYFISDSRSGRISVVRGNSIIRSWTGRDGQEMPIVVSDTIRTFGVFPADTGSEYDLDGIWTGTDYPDQGGPINQRLDGGTDGESRNFLAAFNDRAIWQYDRDWKNPVRLFAVSLPTGVTYDTSTGNLWVIEFGTKTVIEYTTDGQRLSSFGYTTPSTWMGALAYEPATDTLWATNFSSDDIYQFSKDGKVLQNLKIPGLAGYAWGGEFVINAAPGCNPCDANCDGSVDLTDVEPFIGLLLGEDPCAFCTGDTNDDGSIDLTDVEGFIECLLG